MEKVEFNLVVRAGAAIAAESSATERDDAELKSLDPGRFASALWPSWRTRLAPGPARDFDR